MIVLIYILCFYFSLPGFLKKAGYSYLKGLIPFYNIYLLCLSLKVNPFILGMLSLGLIFLPCRTLIGTILIIFLPFIISDAYNCDDLKMAFLTLIFPFFMYPYQAYVKGFYTYNMEEEA